MPEVELTVIDGVDEFLEETIPSCDVMEFPSFESCLESENLLEFNPKFATPLVTLATSELKKLILTLNNTLSSTLENSVSLLES